MRKIFRRFSCERERFRLPFGKIAGPAHASCACCRPEASAAKAFVGRRRTGNAEDAGGTPGRGGQESGQRTFDRGSSTGDPVRGGRRCAREADALLCAALGMAALPRVRGGGRVYERSPWHVSGTCAAPARHRRFSCLFIPEIACAPGFLLQMTFFH